MLSSITELWKQQKRAQQRQSDKSAAGKADTLLSFLVMSLPFSSQPLAREAGERDHVGPFLSRFPISACIPEDHDEVERQ